MKAKRTGVFENVFVLAVGVAIVLLVWQYRNTQVDDAFITYRYARNLANGLGFAYNPPQQVLGTTTPLYTLLLAGASLLGLDIPSVSLVLGGMGVFAVALLFFHVGRQQSGWLSTYLPALLVVLIPGSVLILGMETAFYTTLLYLVIYAAASNRHSLAIVAAASATLTRYDGVLVAAVILFYEWYATRRFPLKRGLLYISLLIPWLVYATLTFGSPLPNTFFAKTGEYVGNVFINELPMNFLALIGFFSLDGISGWVMGLVVLLLCGIGFFSAKNIFVRLLAAWAGFYLIAYALLGIRYTFHWYYYPLIPALLLILIVAVQAGYRRLRELIVISVPGLRWFFAQVFVIILILPLMVMIFLGDVRLYTQADSLPALGGRNVVYRLSAEWLCQNTDEQATIAVPEIGLIGWYCDRKIIDPFGLVSPEMIPYIQQGDRLGGVVALRPDYVVITNISKNSETFSVPGYEHFQDKYKVAHVIDHENNPYFLVIFERE